LFPNKKVFIGEFERDRSLKMVDNRRNGYALVREGRRRRGRGRRRHDGREKNLAQNTMYEKGKILLLFTLSKVGMRAYIQRGVCNYNRTVKRG